MTLVFDICGYPMTIKRVHKDGSITYHCICRNRSGILCRGVTRKRVDGKIHKMRQHNHEQDVKLLNKELIRSHLRALGRKYPSRRPKDIFLEAQRDMTEMVLTDFDDYDSMRKVISNSQQTARKRQKLNEKKDEDGKVDQIDMHEYHFADDDNNNNNNYDDEFNDEKTNIDESLIEDKVEEEDFSELLALIEEVVNGKPNPTNYNEMLKS